MTDGTTNAVREHISHIRNRVDSIDQRWHDWSCALASSRDRLRDLYVSEAVDRIRARLGRVERRLVLTE